MFFKYSNDMKFINKIENLYLSSFPKEERFPFWLLEECSKESNSELCAIIDNNEFVGMCYIVDCDNAYYLMYLAVDPNLRNKNYGSKILSDLKEKYKTLFLSIDEPTNEINVRRKNFYLRNGFFDTNKFYEDTGVNYEVLCTNEKFDITDENMRKRYSNMSNKPEILNVISNTFNMGKINLKNKQINKEELNF